MLFMMAFGLSFGHFITLDRDIGVIRIWDFWEVPAPACLASPLWPLRGLILKVMRWMRVMSLWMAQTSKCQVYSHRVKSP